MKKIILLPMILLSLMSMAMAVPYNISCNEDLSSGTYDLDADMSCGANAIFHAEDEAEIIINCQGHSMTLSASAGDFITLDNITNITIRDCAGLLGTNSPTNQIHVTDYDFFLFENNTLSSYVGLKFDVGTQPPIGRALHIINNHFNFYSQTSSYASIQMTTNHNDSDSALPPTIDISHNFFNITGVGFPPSYRNRTFLGDEHPVSDGESVYSTWNISSSVGNYYTYYLEDTWHQWVCNDVNGDGICDDPFFQDNSGIGGTSYYDYFALSEYPYDGCVPVWICSGYSACNISHLQSCNAVTDNNTCGDSYTGDMSEFSPQSCNFGTTVLIDDFNESNGAVDTSKQNDMGYYYQLDGCDYSSEVMYCANELNRNRFDFVDESIIAFDADCDLWDCYFYLGNVSDIKLGLRISNADQKLYWDYDVTEQEVISSFGAVTSGWHHYEIFVNDTAKKANVLVDGVNYGQWDFTDNISAVQQYEISHIEGEASLYFDNMTIEAEYCTPDWVCAGYGSCNISDLAPCNETVDNNACGDPYTGDYSEFSPQPCNYCSADTELILTGDCDSVTDTQTLYYTDNNWEICCNITQIAGDCPSGTNSSDYEDSQSCSIYDYTEGDIPRSIISTITKFFLEGYGYTVLFVFLGLLGLTLDLRARGWKLK